MLYLDQREDWRAWLAEYHSIEKEAWLVYPRKHTGKTRILYNDTVEEALCFGWIDSTNKKVDEDHTAQRFTLRRPKSGYSQTNIERIRRLLEQGKIIPEMMDEAKRVAAKMYEFPEDILSALKANEAAWRNFQRYSNAYQRIRIAYIDRARLRGEEFEKRLNNFLKKTEQDQQFGFGIEGYF